MVERVFFTDEELIVIGLSLMAAATGIAMTRDMLQEGLDHNQIGGGLTGILNAMEAVTMANHQLDVIGGILSKLEQAA